MMKWEEFNERANRLYTKRKGIVITCVSIVAVLAFVLGFVVTWSQAVPSSDGQYIVYEQLQNGQTVETNALFACIRTGISLVVLIVVFSIIIFKKWPRKPRQT